MVEARYTPEQLASAEQFAFFLGTLPKEKRETVVMMANAFISGMEAQERISAKPTDARPSA